MKKFALSIVASIYVMSGAAADAATFRVETHSRGYVLYSTYEKPERCEINIYFTFMHEGTRKDGESLCTTKPVPEGKDVKFCEFSHERMVDPVVSKPMKITCTPE